MQSHCKYMSAQVLHSKGYLCIVGFLLVFVSHAQATVLEPPPSIFFFEADQSRLNEKSQRTARTLAQWLLESPDCKIILEGHTDQTGTREYNLRLAQHRANVIKDHLISLNIPSSSISAISYGEEKPNFKPAHPNSENLNRRVEAFNCTEETDINKKAKQPFYNAVDKMAQSHAIYAACREHLPANSLISAEVDINQQAAIFFGHLEDRNFQKALKHRYETSLVQQLRDISHAIQFGSMTPKECAVALSQVQKTLSQGIEVPPLKEKQCPCALSQCFTPEDLGNKQIEITGVLDKRLAYGPPGWGETPKQDDEFVYYVIELQKPFCLSQSNGDNKYFLKSRDIQITGEIDDQSALKLSMKKSTIKAKGYIWRGHSPWHQLPLLFDLISLSSTPLRH